MENPISKSMAKYFGLHLIGIVDGERDLEPLLLSTTAGTTDAREKAFCGDSRNT